MYLIASVCVRYINVEKITTENQLKYASYFTTMQNYHFYSCYICIRILHTEDIFFSGITTKFCNSFKKIPFHWPKLVFYTQRLITLIKPVFKHRLCKKTFYKNVYTVNLPIRYAKKKKRSKVKLYIDDRYWEILQIHLPYCTWYHVQCTQYDKISNYRRSFQNN